MPAVTVDDILLLPRIEAPDAAVAKDRPVLGVTTAPRGFEGEGFPVRRAFAGVDLRALDPFIHMDQMGEVDYAPGEPKGTAWHPHRGFETVTYIIDGTFQHQDSHGGGGVITNGDTQWMTAGGGHPAHRDAARGAGRQRRPVPRHPAVGQPAVRAQDGRAALPGPPGRPGRAAQPRRTVARCVRVIAGRRRRPRRAGRHAHARSPWLHATVEPGAAAAAAVAAGLQRPGLRAGRRRARSAPSGGRSRRASWPCSGRATCSPSARSAGWTGRPTSSTSCSSAASRSASRSRRTGRS